MPETALLTAMACAHCTVAIIIKVVSAGSAVKIKSYSKGTRHRAKISSRVCVTPELGLEVSAERFARVGAGKYLWDLAQVNKAGEAVVTFG